MGYPKVRIRVFLVLIVFLDLIGFSVIFPIIPDLMEFYVVPLERGSGGLSSWIAGHHQSAVVVLGGIASSLWAFLQFLSAPIWGRISDRIGRKKVLFITAAGLSVSYLIWVFADTLPLFIVHRIIGGIMAGNIGVAYAAMADITDEKERTQEMGLMGAAAGTGMIIGPVLGGLLSAGMIRDAVSAVPFLHPFSAAAAASAALFALNAFLMKGFPETGRAAVHDRKAPLFQLIPDIDIPGFRRIALVNFLFALSFAGIELIFPYFLKQKFNASPDVLGFFFLYLGVTMAAGEGILIRIFLTKFSEKKILIIGLALIPGSVLLTALAARTIMEAVILSLPLAVGAALAGPSMAGLVSHRAPEGQQGYVLGLFNAYGSLAYIFGPLVAAAVYGSGGIITATAIIALLLFAGIIAASGITAKPRSSSSSS